MSDTPIGAPRLHDDSPTTPKSVLEVQGVTKSFGPLSVLRGIDLDPAPGEVLGLVGDNGAGKSTLVKILSGLLSHRTSGRILVKGHEVHFRSVEDATAHGIETVYQDLALIPQLPVFLNLFLNHEITHFGPLQAAQQAQDARARQAATSTTSTSTCRTSTPRRASSRAASGRRSPSRERRGQTPTSFSSTSHWPPWGHASHGSSSTS